jgi:hypothetical protein
MSGERIDSTQQPDQDKISAEILRGARRSQSRRLARIYADILNEGSRQKSPEQEDREWQLATKPVDSGGDPGWRAVLKRGAWFALPLAVGPFALVLIGEWLFPRALHRLNPNAVADLVVILFLGSPIAFLIGMLTAKERTPVSIAEHPVSNAPNARPDDSGSWK